MPRKSAPRRGKTTRQSALPKVMSGAAFKRASIFRNGSNQAVRLPQELRFPEGITEVRVRKQGDALLLSPVRPDWPSFFALEVEVPEDFLTERRDEPPQSRDPL
jgi:antitoxin VapB